MYGYIIMEGILHSVVLPTSKLVWTFTGSSVAMDVAGSPYGLEKLCRGDHGLILLEGAQLDHQMS